MLTAAGLAQALGGRREGVHWMARCPAHADRTPSLALRDGHTGVLVHCHAGCSQEAVIAALRGRGLWEAAYVPIPRNSTATRSVKAPPLSTERLTNLQRPAASSLSVHVPELRNPNLARAADIWRAAVDPRGTLAESYLTSRELELPDDPARVLRYHPRCPFAKGAFHPALVALFTDIHSDEPRAIHRIALNPDPEALHDKVVLDAAGRPLKMMLGPVKGCAVKISADEDVTQGLSIAEGIETALALWCWRWRPIWALGSAGAMEGFPILPGITALTVFTDNDASGTGLKAAKACQRRWCDARIETKVFMPRGKGCDWADEWAVR